MSNLSRAAAIVLVLVPLASGCQLGMPRWDWWRSAQTGPPPGAMVAANNAPKYPDLPSSTAAPANLTVSTGSANATPPGTSAPATGYPSTETSTASATVPTGYPSTAATGAYPSSPGSYAPQTGSYDANAYNPNAGATQPAAHVASNPNPYAAPAGGYNPSAGAYPSTGGYPATNSPAGYPGTPNGSYNAPAGYGAPAGTAPYGATPGAADTSSYGSGSRYDAPTADRYGAGATAPNAPNYGAPAGTGYPPPTNNYGAPAGPYPAAPADGGYRGSDAAAPTGTTNYAASPGASNDRYSNYDQTGTTAGPVATTADLRNGTTPVSVPRYDSAVTPASGGTYLPAGTKLLEGELPSAPASTPAGGTSTTPYGYQTPGSMG